MYRSKTIVLTVVILTVVIIGTIAAMLVPSAEKDDDALVIVLPAKGNVRDGPVDFNRENRELASRVTVTPQNLCAVLEALKCPESYIREAEVVYYYGSDSGKVILKSRVSGEKVRVSLSGAVSQEILISDGEYYVWEKDPKKYFKGAAENWKAEDISLTPDWRALVKAGNVISASPGKENGYDIIAFSFSCGDAVWDMSVSVDTGLLISAAERDGSGKTVYSMSAGLISVEKIEDSVFKKP